MQQLNYWLSFKARRWGWIILNALEKWKNIMWTELAAVFKWLHMLFPPLSWGGGPAGRTALILSFQNIPWPERSSSPLTRPFFGTGTIQHVFHLVCILDTEREKIRWRSSHSWSAQVTDTIRTRCLVCLRSSQLMVIGGQDRPFHTASLSSSCLYTLFLLCVPTDEGSLFPVSGSLNILSYQRFVVRKTFLTKPDVVVAGGWGG